MENFFLTPEKVMCIDFFAQRFGFNPRLASWAVIHLFNEDGDHEIIPAVYLGDGLFINIIKDKIEVLNNTGGCHSYCEHAIVVKKRRSYDFTDGKNTICSISVRKLNSQYVNTKAILAKAKCLR